MAEPEPSTYVLEFRDGSNCAVIEGAMPEKEILVLVRNEHDAKAKPIVAKGTRSKDGASFSVVVTTAAGEYTHVWNYQALLEAIAANRPD